MEEGLRKKRKDLPAAGWEMIYCSLVLIIVALFAMLVSYSDIKKDRVNLFKGEKGLIQEGGKPDKASNLLNLSPDILGKQDEFMMQTMKSLKAYLRQAGLDKSVSMEKTEKGFKAIFESNVLFPSGVAEINKEACPFLDEAIKILRNRHLSIRVEGHTDTIPINTPSFPSNWELSTTRAVNILRYFIEKGKLPADRLFAVGFSQYHPIESNDTPEGRQKNRRVEFYFEL